MLKYGRTYNFSAGPAMMPEEVLEEIAAEVMNYHGSGMSVMEMSHRSKPYQQIIDEAEANLRSLMGIPDNYKVLFMQGGASSQFAMVPLNLMKTGKADYVVTGQFSGKAAEEAKKDECPRGDEHQKNSVARGLVHPFLISLSQGFAQQGVHAHADTGGKADLHILYRERQPQRCHGTFGNLGHINAVHHIVHSLDQHRNNHRQCHRQQQLAHRHHAHFILPRVGELSAFTHCNASFKEK